MGGGIAPDQTLLCSPSLGTLLRPLAASEPLFPTCGTGLFGGTRTAGTNVSHAQDSGGGRGRQSHLYLKGLRPGPAAFSLCISASVSLGTLTSALTLTP